MRFDASKALEVLLHEQFELLQELWRADLSEAVVEVESGDRRELREFLLEKLGVLKLDVSLNFLKKFLDLGVV